MVAETGALVRAKGFDDKSTVDSAGVTRTIGIFGLGVKVGCLEIGANVVGISNDGSCVDTCTTGRRVRGMAVELSTLTRTLGPLVRERIVVGFSLIMTLGAKVGTIWLQRGSEEPGWQFGCSLTGIRGRYVEGSVAWVVLPYTTSSSSS